MNDDTCNLPRDGDMKMLVQRYADYIALFAELFKHPDCLVHIESGVIMFQPYKKDGEDYHPLVKSFRTLADQIPLDAISRLYLLCQAAAVLECSVYDGGEPDPGALDMAAEVPTMPRQEVEDHLMASISY
jgi:hypothetical protein